MPVGYALRDPATSEENLHFAPLVECRGDEWAIYYVPWFVRQPEDDGTKRLLERFGETCAEEETA